MTKLKIFMWAEKRYDNGTINYWIYAQRSDGGHQIAFDEGDYAELLDFLEHVQNISPRLPTKRLISFLEQRQPTTEAHGRIEERTWLRFHDKFGFVGWEIDQK